MEAWDLEELAEEEAEEMHRGKCVQTHDCSVNLYVLGSIFVELIIIDLQPKCH